MYLYKNTEELINKIGKRIEDILEEKDFELSTKYLLYIHNYLFKDIEVFPNPDKFRTYNITRNEEILNGDTVIYADYHDICSYLEYDFNETKKYNFNNINNTIKNISIFSSKVWQAHPFTDGNTRTTNVLIKKYLNTLGYQVDNSIFKDNNLYFRNALVRSNYSNQSLGITSDIRYLELFYKKLLLDSSIPLNNDDLYIKPSPKTKKLEKK